MKFNYQVKLLGVLIFILIQTFDTFIETRLNISHSILFYSSYIGFAAFLIIACDVRNISNILPGFLSVSINIISLNFITIIIVIIIQTATKGTGGAEDLLNSLNARGQSDVSSDVTFANFKELKNSISDFILVIMVVSFNHYVRTSWESSFKWRVIGGYLIVMGFCMGLFGEFLLNNTPILLSGLIIPYYIILLNSTFVYVIEQNTAVLQRKPYAVIAYDFFKIINPMHNLFRKFYA